MSNESWDETVDILVAGSGAAGLACALVATGRGADVLVAEKASIVGGTTRKSAAYTWIPNNTFMRTAGLEDPRDGALRYMARLSRPLRYDPDHPTLGLPKWEYEAIQAHYDDGAEAITELESLGGVTLAHAADFPDYYAHIPEDEAPKGRVLFPAAGEGGPQGGQILVDELHQACTGAGAQIRVDAPVTGLVTDGQGAVVGAVVGEDAKSTRIRTARGVVFATGSFAQNAELCLRYLDHPYIGAASALTCTGDFVQLGRAAGADFANMNLALRAPMIIERMEREPAEVRPSFIMSGDGLIIVNRFGRRVYSEKASYHDLARAFFDWDPVEASYPNIPLIAVWDATQAARFGADALGNPVPPPGMDDYWVIKGADLDELQTGIADRLTSLRTSIGRPHLADEFGRQLRETIARYAGFAERGVDDDFGRGSTPSQIALGGLFGLGDGPNPTLRALDADGPYFATILGPGLFETSGGPRTDTCGRVVRPDGSPIAGLYAAGTCAAAPWGEASWSGGMNVGYALTAGYRAGKHAAETRTAPARAAVNV
jgi:succinate dehydrogenase/fumarate reductase flavoprotein subunit